MIENNDLWDVFEETEAQAKSSVDNLASDVDKVSDIANASLEVQLEYYENQLMAFLVRDFSELRSQVARLSPSYFRNENYVLFTMLFKVSNERSLTIDSNYLKVYLQSHRAELSQDKDRIEFEAFETDGFTGIDGVLVQAVKSFELYKSESFITLPSFEDALSRFRNVFMGLELNDLLQTATTALSHPVYYKRKPYVGTSGTLSFLSKKINEVKALNEEDSAYRLVNASEEDFDDEDERVPTLLTEFPTLPTFNEALNGLRTNTLVTFVAPEKGMKSKTAVSVTHSVMMNGFNACFWGKEGGSRKVKAELRAVHFNYYYNTIRSQGQPKVSAQDIMMGTLDPKLKELELISRTDLFKNTKYGTLFLPEFPFELENLEMVIREAAEENDCKFFAIDYVQIMDSKQFKEDRIIIERAYSKLESLKGILDVCIWCPAQMSTEAVQAYGNGQHRESRNITAKSSEPTKSADVNLLLYVNDEMEKNSLAKVYYLPSRYYGNFEAFDVYTDKVANGLYEVQNQKLSVVDGELKLMDDEEV